MLSMHLVVSIFQMLYSLQLTAKTAAVMTNISVDDQYGDSVTKASPSYYPPGKWSQGQQCHGCEAQPNPAYAFDHSLFPCSLAVILEDKRKFQLGLTPQSAPMTPILRGTLPLVLRASPSSQIF
jgi:hypothetical protein